MNSNLSRRSLLGASLGVGASFGMVRIPASLRDEAVEAQVPETAVSVTQFGAKGDGTTDDGPAFQAAIAAAAKSSGVVLVPPSTHSRYLIGAPIILAPEVTIQGAGGASPTLQLAGNAPYLFSYVGDAEAVHLHAAIRNLNLNAGTTGTGTAVHLRNFSGLYLRHVSINRFNTGVAADWGIGLHLYASSISHCVRGLNVGGRGAPGGIRVGLDEDFMDTIVVDACGFAMNEIDVNDMGSTRSLGGIAIRDTSFYENYRTPIATKRGYIHIANRKGINISCNWFECGQPSRTTIYLGNVDYDGRSTGMCHGAAIFSNMILSTAKNDAVGVELAACGGAAVFGNCFEFAAGNHPIRLSGAGGSDAVEKNSFLTYPDRPEYANPVGQ